MGEEPGLLCLTFRKKWAGNPECLPSFPGKVGEENPATWARNPNCMLSFLSKMGPETELHCLASPAKSQRNRGGKQIALPSFPGKMGKETPAKRAKSTKCLPIFPGKMNKKPKLRRNFDGL
jgi:hypothetical protein